MSYWTLQDGASPLLQVCHVMATMPDKTGQDKVVPLLLARGADVNIVKKVVSGNSVRLLAGIVALLAICIVSLSSPAASFYRAHEQSSQPIPFVLFGKLVLQHAELCIVLSVCPQADISAMLYYIWVCFAQDGTTALYWACMSGNMKVVQQLLSKGADTKPEDPVSDCGLLMSVPIYLCQEHAQV